jgi:hypothetical protein
MLATTRPPSAKTHPWCRSRAVRAFVFIRAKPPPWNTVRNVFCGCVDTQHPERCRPGTSPLVLLDATTGCAVGCAVHRLTFGLVDLSAKLMSSQRYSFCPRFVPQAPGLCLPHVSLYAFEKHPPVQHLTPSPIGQPQCARFAPRAIYLLKPRQHPAPSCHPSASLPSHHSRPGQSCRRRRSGAIARPLPGPGNQSSSRR